MSILSFQAIAFKKSTDFGDSKEYFNMEMEFLKDLMNNSTVCINEIWRNQVIQHNQECLFVLSLFQKELLKIQSSKEMKCVRNQIIPHIQQDFICVNRISKRIDGKSLF
jgi:hypothetical protein